MLLLGLSAYAQTARVVLRWKAAPGLVSYQVQIAGEAAFSKIVLDEKVNEPVLKWESLPTTVFYWRVRTFDTEGRASEWSAPRQIAPATGPPAPKLPAAGTTLLCATEPVPLVLETSAVLKDYILELSTDGLFSPGQFTVLTSKTGEFRAVLPAGTTSWRGRGIDLTGRTTDPSGPRKLSVKLAAPRVKPAPDVPAGTSSVTLAWTASPCARNYLVEASYEGPEHAVHEAHETQMSFKPTGVGEYRFRVAARDDQGNQSDWSAEGKFRVRLPAPVARAETVRPSEASGSEVELAWNPSPQAVTYGVEVSRSETFKDATPFSVTTSSHRAKWAPGKYLWRVTARDGAGHLSFSSEPRSFVVPAPGAEGVPKVSMLAPVDGAAVVGSTSAPVSFPRSPSGTQFASLTLAAVLGGRFNFAAVHSPSGVLSLGYRASPAHGLFTAQLRAEIYGAAATVQSPDGPMVARVTAPSLSLVVGAHHCFGVWTLSGVIGGGAQVAVSAVGEDSQTQVLPAFELVTALGRRLGPGAVEVELSFLYSRLNIPLAQLQAGGLFVGIGYRFDLSGGK